MKLTRLLIALVVLGLTAGTLRAQDDPTESAPTPAYQVDDGQVLFEFGPDGEGGFTIATFTEVVQELTGKRFLLHSRVPRSVFSTPVTLYGDVALPLPEVYSFFESVVYAHGFACVEWGERAGAFTEIVPVQQPHSSHIMDRAKWVSANEAASYAARPATFLRVIVPLRNINSQSVGANLRAATSHVNANYAAFIPLPNENALLVSGFGGFVAGAVTTLQQLDAAKAIEQDG